MKKIMLLVGLFALCVSAVYAARNYDDNNLLGYPGRIIRQTGNVVSSVLTDLPETPRETAYLAGEVLTPFGHPEN